MSWLIRRQARSVRLAAGAALILCATPSHGFGQVKEDVPAKMQQLDRAIATAEARLQESQRELDSLKEQMRSLEQQISSMAAAPEPSPLASTDPEPDARSEEHESIQDSQLATLQQIKVESDSKYPLRLSGLILANAFVNAQDVDNATGPALALAGGGNTALTLRQTVLGLDARGPRLLGAHSYADLRMDFAGSSAGTTTAGIYSGGYGASTNVLRLRTAHAGLLWPNAEAYFAMDRPIISPGAPTSLAAVAEPPLSWSGNLWVWSPQAAARWFVPIGERSRFVLEGAVIDVPDAPLTPQFYTATQAQGPNTGEFSRWPGAEVRLGWAGGSDEDSNRIGAGGYFSRRRYPSRTMDSWAATLDSLWKLPGRTEFTGSFYRGLALGGLGGGGYKDYLFRSYATYIDFTPLDDVGGWAEVKEKINQRLQFNAAYGADQLFARELREYEPVLATAYQRLARNQTFTANVIYSPSAYLLYSLEYRHIVSFPVTGKAANSNIVVLSAGYRF